MLFSHGLEDVIGNRVGVLNGIDSGIGGSTRGAIANGVRGDFAVVGMRFFDDGFELVEGNVGG